MIKSVDAFVSSFWKWWDFVNPPWHIRVDSRLKIGGAGPWDSHHRPGQNGFLSVLQILSWWRGLLGVEGTEDWDSAIGDITWVMKQVLHLLISPSKKRIHDNKLESSDQDDVMPCRLPRR
jgi:hypothetical protein